MELNRLRRVLYARWWLVILIALVGVAAALAFTSVANQNRRPVYKATGSIQFELQEDSTVAELEAEITEASATANLAAADLLIADETSAIVTDIPTGRLLFMAQSDTPEGATNKTQALIDAFFVTDSIGGDVSERLLIVEGQIVDISIQIAELEPKLTPEQEATVQAHADLDSEEGAVKGRLVAIVIEEASADADLIADLTAEKAALNAELDRIEAQRIVLGPIPVAELTPEESLKLLTLQNHQEILTADYEELFLRQLGVTGSGSVQAIGVEDLTPSPADPVVNGAIGLVAGLVIGVMALMFATRARKAVWLPEDLPIPTLGVVPGRRAASGVGATWYDTSEGSSRKVAIQTLRSVVEAQIPASGATLAISGRNTTDEAVHALTTDLAVSMASAGSSVLLVDADLDSGEAIGEYRVGGSSLSVVFEANPDSIGFEREVERVVDGAFLIRPGLAVVPSGPAPVSPADALAGPQFRTFIDKAEKQFDVVIVAVPDIATPAAKAAMRRLRRGIMVLTPGQSTIPEIESVVTDLSQRQVSIVGAVFIDRHERTIRPKQVSESSPQREDSTTVAEEQVLESPIARLGHYPIPGERSAVVESNPMRELADQIAVADGGAAIDEALGGELLSALDSANGKAAVEAVADYLVTRTEDMLQASYGQGGFSEELIDAVSSDGFVSLRPLADHSTVGQWLEDELKREMTQQTAQEVMDRLERILSKQAGKVTTVDVWLSEQFFTRHLARTEGEPDIWHLTSSAGTVQVLLPARRLDHDRIELLISDVASRTIDELMRYRKAAATRGDLEQADVFEGRIHEVRQFSTALGQLIGMDERGSADFIWTPDWGEGIRANLAPFQRVGVLPVRVLSDAEVSSALSVG